MPTNVVIRDHELHCNDCDENLSPANELNRLGFLFHLLADHHIEAGEPLVGLDRMEAIVQRALLRAGVLVIPADVVRTVRRENEALQ